jgi:hypothetical protein
MFTSPFFFTFTLGAPRMEAAVAKPCGLVCAFLMIFFVLLTA